MKKIDLSKSVYDLTEEYPDIIEIMVESGFKDVKNPVVRKTAGRAMTIPKGCNMRGIELETIIKKLEEKGFEIIE